MTKNSKEQIDQDEKKILSELVKNSNENIETIAKHCGFSRQKTWRTIKHLEEKGVIWGYTAVFDEEKIGQQHFMLMINRTMEKMEEKVVDIIISSKTNALAKELGVTIESSAYVHGEYDWIMTITAENIIQAKQFSDALVTLYPRGSEKITILQTMMFIRKQYILNPDRKKLKEFM
jgi:Lrp/AsnC family transcriptional regulator, leucine-responsive regulatory protein